MKRHIREAIIFLEEQGASDCDIEYSRSGHPKIVYNYGGQPFRRQVPCTPSDRNWMKQFQRDFRRLHLPAKAAG